MNTNLFSLYINIPFCKSKCSYCDYITVPDYNNYSDKYIDSLLNEMKQYKNYKIKTIYIGGGTPSILNNKNFKKLINAINNNFNIPKLNEFTIEMNPGDVNEKNLHLYKEMNVTRISLGVQSFNNTILKYLGKHYDESKIIESIELIQKYFNNFNIDILFVIPEIHNLKILKNDIKTAINYSIPHIAVYNLELSPNTYFGWLLKKNKLKMVNDELYTESYNFFTNYLTQHNYRHYEISSFSKKKFECKHNLTYWNNQEYIGLGSSAHSYINNKRFWNYKFPKHYITAINKNGNAIENSEQLDFNNKLNETIMLYLHLDTGIPISYINNKFKIDFKNKFNKEINNLLNQKFIEINNNSIILTSKGKLFTNKVTIEFFR